MSHKTNPKVKAKTDPKKPIGAADSKATASKRPQASKPEPEAPEVPIAPKAPSVSVTQALAGVSAPAPGKPKRHITAAHRVITDRIVEMLGKNIVPWHRPWKVDGAPCSVTGRPYRGVNPFCLALTAQACGYASPVWLTLNKIEELGGKLKAVPPSDRQVGDKSASGQHPTPVVFWKMVVRKKVEDTDESSEDENATSGETKKPKKFPMLKYYQVFNLDQVEGIDKTRWETKAPKIVVPPNEAVKNVLDAYQGGPKIVHGVDFLRGQTQAWYSPKQDQVHLPPVETFTSGDAYHGTLFHELGHSTGHQSRLSRPGVTDLDMFGSHQYAEEELVAEMTACFLMSHVGIGYEQNEQMDQHVAYIQNWMQALKNDPTLIVRVAGLAQRAYDHILGVKWGEGETQETETATAV